jgi:hypothetical protein
MSSEHLASAQNELKGNLGGAWNILDGAQGQYQDLGIARRFGAAAAAYSLRDIGAMNGRVVKARRDVGETSDPEEDFSASQVQSGALEDYINGKLEDTLPADVATAAAAYSLRKVKATYSGDAVRIRRSSDDIEVDVAFDSDDKVSASSAITNIAEQGGESGQTTDTTLGDFISGTDAFVHTWYDQAGSNDATQATDANQPKIAENGALLADGLDFDGTDSLVTGSFSASQPITIFSVTETDVTTGTRIVESETNTNLFYYGSSVQIGFTSGANLNSAVGGYSINVPYLLTHLANGSSSKIFRNSSEIASGNAGTNSFAGSLHIGGSTNHLNGRFRELVIYDSDQSDNRFKIESNINNYYSLYNDENDLSSAFLNDATDPFDTFTGTKDGFVGVHDAPNTFGRAEAQLAQDGVSGNQYHISFNLDLNVAFVANKLFLALKAADGTTTTSTATYDVVEGFNSVTLEANATSRFIHFAFSIDDTVTYTVSNFKVSRIARNGFVETWYDQSGNSNNATQASAGQQPAIVQNGGICKSNGSPSVFFTGDTRDDELDFTDLTLTDATIFTVVNIDSSADQQIIIGGGSVSTSTGTMMPMMDNASSTTQVYKNSTVGGAEQGSSQFKNGSAVTLSDRDDAFDNLAVDSQILFTMVDVDVAEAKVLDGISRTPSDALTFHLQGQMNELIIYNSDLSSDRGTIESEIANHYNITLS